jgi:hypothetical protein
MERLARDPGERRRLGASGRAVAPQYDWSTLIDSYESDVLDRYLPVDEA